MTLHDEIEVIDPLAPTFPDSEERGLVHAILESPHDSLPRLVYADWLEERGDRRFEYLRVTQQLAEGDLSKITRDRAKKLRLIIHPTWLGLMEFAETLQSFQVLQRQISNWDENARGWKPSLQVEQAHGLLDIRFYGSLLIMGDGEDVGALFDLLARPRTAACIRTIALEGHEDRGRCNGTLEIEILRMLETGAKFSHLQSFETERGSGIVINSYREEGALGKLLQQCPNLWRLIVPSAPDTSFFARTEHPLKALSIDAGYDHEQFLLNLGKSTCFPRLQTLRFRDYAETYVDRWEDNATPFADYLTFFQSPMMNQLEEIRLETNLQPDQIARLLRLRSQGVTFTPITESN